MSGPRRALQARRFNGPPHRAPASPARPTPPVSVATTSDRAAGGPVTSACAGRRQRQREGCCPCHAGAAAVRLARPVGQTITTPSTQIWGNRGIRRVQFPSGPGRRCLHRCRRLLCEYLMTGTRTCPLKLSTSGLGVRWQGGCLGRGGSQGGIYTGLEGVGRGLGAGAEGGRGCRDGNAEEPLHSSWFGIDSAFASAPLHLLLLVPCFPGSLLRAVCGCCSAALLGPGISSLVLWCVRFVYGVGACSVGPPPWV